jgi:serine/threonine protein kinase
MNIALGLGMLIALTIVVSLLVIACVLLLRPVFQGIGWLVKHVFQYIGGTLSDAFRLIGALLVVLFTAPLAVGCVIIGRWSAAQHYGRAIVGELKSMGRSAYMIVVGRPARLLRAEGLVQGLEQRLPAVVAEAPTSDKPGKRTGQFDGYTIVGSLPGGGSGGKLYIAEPDAMKRAGFDRQGQPGVDRVVIKSFSLRDGSSMPQIVRESRALDAARKLGLVLEHDLAADRFYYVTRYVPGQSLGLVTQQLHAQSPGGLAGPSLTAALGLVTDLVRTLDGYHKGGLWHKDVKPDNIIIETHAGRSQAHLVDFGLVSHLNSAMTLTTHGTEYFRDPEMVRQALRGVKVNEIDGGKFDIYGAGAVLYSVVEGGFPAHGVLSPITKKCPEAVRWIIRRAMTDYEKRYTSAAEMLADLEVVRRAIDPYALRPIDLPSVRTGRLEVEPALQTAAYAPSDAQPGFGATVPPPLPRQAPRVPAQTRRPASEQLASARARVDAARSRAAARRRGRTRTGDIAASTPNAGVFFAIALTGAVLTGGVVLVSSLARGSGRTVAVAPAAVPATPATPATPDPGATAPVEVVFAPPTPAAPTAPAAPVVTAPPELTDPRALVIVDIQRPLTRTAEQTVTSAVERLTSAGFEVVGEYAPSDPALANAVDVDELTVQARYQMGGTAIDSPSGQQQLGEWLATAPGVDLAVWIRSAPAGPGDAANPDKVQCFVVKPWGPSVDEARQTRTGTLGRVALRALGLR